VLIAVHTDAEVDLVRIGIGAKRRHESEYRVGDNRG